MTSCATRSSDSSSRRAGIVLDLRGNGGGLLDEAVLVPSVFVEDGVIVSTDGRAQPQQDYEASEERWTRCRWS